MTLDPARDLATLADRTDGDIDALLHAAAAFRQGRTSRSLEGRTLGLVFLNPSLRTRSSMEAAAFRLGGHAVVLAPGGDAWRIETRDGVVMDGDAAEHVREAAGVLSRHHAILGVRSFAGLREWSEDREDPVLTAFRHHATVPVVNMESARWHPLQALADRLTIRDALGDDVAGRRIVLAWAYHPRPLPTAVPASFLAAVARTGAEVVVTHPEGFDLPEDVLATARRDAADRSGSVAVTHDRDAALAGARVVYAKSWGSPAWCGRWEEERPLRQANRTWIVDRAAMARTDDAVLLHCLPVRRGVVVSDEVIDGPRSRVLDQAANRLFTAMAVLDSMAGAIA